MHEADVTSKRVQSDDLGCADVVWDGITKRETLTHEAAVARDRLADCSKRFDWKGAVALLRKHPSLVNVTRPGGRSWFAPLHQAAYGGASMDIVNELVSRGAWRCLRTSDGRRPQDIALSAGHLHLAQLLAPVYEQQATEALLYSLQTQFHEIIRQRGGALVREHSLRLPELEVMLEFRARKFWFAVPGMYGGFSFWLAGRGDEVKLVTESWSRMCSGSGQRHEITTSGCALVDEGFV